MLEIALGHKLTIFLWTETQKSASHTIHADLDIVTKISKNGKTEVFTSTGT